MTLFAQLWILCIAPTNGAMSHADYTYGGGRTTRNTKYPCFMGISMPITQTAPNIDADHVIRGDQGLCLQHQRPVMRKPCYCHNAITTLYRSLWTHTVFIRTTLFFSEFSNFQFTRLLFKRYHVMWNWYRLFGKYQWIIIFIMIFIMYLCSIDKLNIWLGN